MEYTLVEEPAKLVIGIAIRTSNASAEDISHLWDRFYRENIVSKIPNKATPDVVALYCDYEGDHTKPYTLIIGCKVSTLKNIPSGLVGKELPSTTYAAFKAKGPFPKTLIEAWQTVWESDLKRSFVGDLEVYGPGFQAQPLPEVDLYISINK